MSTCRSGWSTWPLWLSSPSYDVIQVSKKQFDSYTAAVCDLTCVALVTLHQDRLKALRARNVNFEGSFPQLINPSRFRGSLDDLFHHFLGLPK